MRKFKRIVGCVVIMTIAGSAWGLESKTAADAPSQITISTDYRPSQQADLLYYILVAETAGKRGQLDVALENYQAAARISDDPRLAERAMGIALLLNRGEAALEAARRWNALEPDNRKAQQMLVLVLLRNQAMDEAGQRLDEIRRVNSDDGQDGFATIGALLGQVDDRDLVFQIMVAMRDRYPDSPFANYYFALAAVGKGERQQALASLNTTLVKKPDWSQAHLFRAQILVEMGNIEQALDGMDRVVAERPEDQRLRMGYARLLVEAKRPEEAQKEFQKLLDADPENVEALYALGLLMMQAKQLDKAEHYLMQVMRRGVRLMDVYYEMGRLEELRENYAKAKDWYMRVTDQGRFLGAQVQVGKMLARLDDFTSLKKHMGRLRQDHHENAVILFLAEAEILREEGRTREAFELLGQALEQHPRDNDLLYARALIAEKLDRLDILEQDLRAILETDPDNGHALNALGYTLADRTDRYQEALEYLEQAIAMLPEDAAVLDSMGWVKYRLGSYEVSLDYLRRAYERSPDAEIAAHLSEVLWVSGKREEAREIWRNAMERDPGNEFLLKVKERLDL